MLEFCQNLIILSKRIYTLKIFFFKYHCLVSRITSIAYNLSINRHFRTSISIFIFASRIYLFLNERIFFNFINILYIYCNNEQRYQYFFPPTSNLKVEKKKKKIRSTSSRSIPPHNKLRNRINFTTHHTYIPPNHFILLSRRRETF